MQSLAGFSKNIIWKYWYPIVTRITQKAELTFLNYGYDSPDLTPASLPLDPADEENRPFIQLYHQAASYRGLSGLDVLEVSSGHGGGASYIARYLKPKSMIGLERNPKAVAFCQSHYDIPGLKFIEGDAQNIHLPPASIDVIVNVEASHSYGQPDKFATSAARVLKPGGWLLTTDFRANTNLDEWKSYLTAPGLELVRQDDITQNVVDALDIVHDNRAALINSNIPKPIRSIFKQFAGLKGSAIYQKFQSRDYRYMSFALRKG